MIVKILWRAVFSVIVILMLMYILENVTRLLVVMHHQDKLMQ